MRPLSKPEDPADSSSADWRRRFHDSCGRCARSSFSERSHHLRRRTARRTGCRRQSAHRRILSYRPRAAASRASQPTGVSANGSVASGLMWRSIFTAVPRSALIAWLSRARVRIGYDIIGRSWMYTRVVSRAARLRRRHSVENQWDLLEPLGITRPTPLDDPVEMTMNAEAVHRVAARLSAIGVSRPIRSRSLHVSATSPFRRWPMPALHRDGSGARIATESADNWRRSAPLDAGAAGEVVAAAQSRLPAADQSHVLGGSDLSLADLSGPLDQDGRLRRWRRRSLAHRGHDRGANDRALLGRLRPSGRPPGASAGFCRSSSKSTACRAVRATSAFAPRATSAASRGSTLVWSSPRPSVCWPRGRRSGGAGPPERRPRDASPRIGLSTGLRVDYDWWAQRMTMPTYSERVDTDTLPSPAHRARQLALVALALAAPHPFQSRSAKSFWRWRSWRGPPRSSPSVAARRRRAGCCRCCCTGWVSNTSTSDFAELAPVTAQPSGAGHLGLAKSSSRLNGAMLARAVLLQLPSKHATRKPSSTTPCRSAN